MNTVAVLYCEQPEMLRRQARAWLEYPAGLEVLVVDAASPAHEAQMADVAGVLEEIGADAVPQIVVYNKIDAVGRQPTIERDPCGRIISVSVSARTAAGIDLLRSAIGEQARAALDAQHAPAAITEHHHPVAFPDV